MDETPPYRTNAPSTGTAVDNTDKYYADIRGPRDRVPSICLADNVIPGPKTPCLATSCPTPIPWRPVLVLLILTAVQPLAYELVFPFVSELDIHPENRSAHHLVSS